MLECKKVINLKKFEHEAVQFRTFRENFCEPTFLTCRVLTFAVPDPSMFVSFLLDKKTRIAVSGGS